jgi:hypothetical protein
VADSCAEAKARSMVPETRPQLWRMKHKLNHTEKENAAGQ